MAVGECCAKLRLLVLVQVCAWLLPSCSTSGQGPAEAPGALDVVGFDFLLDALSHGDASDRRGPAAWQQGALATGLRRGLADALRDSPRLHVMPHRRSLSPGQDLRLEVGETGHAVTVSRASIFGRRRRPGGPPSGAGEEAALRSAATFHRYDTATPQSLLDLNCTVQAVLKTETGWKNQEYNLISHSLGGSDWILAVVVSDMRNYKLEQWANAPVDQYLESIAYDSQRLGYSIVKYSTGTGQVAWISGTGNTGDADGLAGEAVFSSRITSLAWYPSCSAYAWSINDCPPLKPGPARPNFYQPEGGAQWVYVVSLRTQLCLCVGVCCVCVVLHYAPTCCHRWPLLPCRGMQEEKDTEASRRVRHWAQGAGPSCAGDGASERKAHSVMLGMHEH